MLGGVGNGGRNSVRGSVGELPAARPTERLTAGELGSAMWTGPGERCAALLAEPRPLGVCSLAPWTPHGGEQVGKKTIIGMLGAGEYTECRRRNSSAGNGDGNRSQF